MNPLVFVVLAILILIDGGFFVMFCERHEGRYAFAAVLEGIILLAIVALLNSFL